MDTTKPTQLRTCPQCAVNAPVDAFYCRTNGSPSHLCRACTRAKSAAYRVSNPEKVAHAMRTARSKKPDEYKAKARVLARQRVASGKQAQASAKFTQAHPDRHAAAQAKRRAKRLQATPSWADATAIAEIYAEARRRTALTGTPHDVDHDIPLAGRNVCGLHVANNLQIISAAENKRKGNRYDT